MKVLDLMAGRGGERRRKLIEARGHTLTTLDINPEFECDITADIMDIDDLGLYDFVWASPPCETWSVMAISKNWKIYDDNVYIPQTEKAVHMIGLVEHTIQLMQASAKYAWAMENPMGMLRKMPFVQDIRRQEIHYCQYGERRMKPTDIWTVGTSWQGRPICHRGDLCHDAAPRGSKTGTQGIKGSAERAVVPWELWEEMLIAVEQDILRQERAG